MVRPHRQLPRDRVDDWPPPGAQAEPDLEVARLLATSLDRALAGRSFREAQRATGVDHTTVAAIVNGTTWPDARTIARLEAGLGADLWPSGVAARLGRAGAAK